MVVATAATALVPQIALPDATNSACDDVRPNSLPMPSPAPNTTVVTTTTTPNSCGADQRRKQKSREVRVRRCLSRRRHADADDPEGGPDTRGP